MRAVAKILRARASEHSSYFCEQFEQRLNFASTFKLNGTIRYPYQWTRKTRRVARNEPYLIFPQRTLCSRPRLSSSVAYFKASAFPYLKVPINRELQAVCVLRLLNIDLFCIMSQTWGDLWCLGQGVLVLVTSALKLARMEVHKLHAIVRKLKELKLRSFLIW